MHFAYILAFSPNYLPLKNYPPLQKFLQGGIIFSVPRDNFPHTKAYIVRACVQEGCKQSVGFLFLNLLDYQRVAISLRYECNQPLLKIAVMRDRAREEDVMKKKCTVCSLFLLRNLACRNFATDRIICGPVRNVSTAVRALSLRATRPFAQA